MKCPHCGKPVLEAANFCPACGFRQKGALEELRVVTILVADVRGFTALSEHMDPEDVKETMNSLFTVAEKVIEEKGGTVDKYMGDAVMAVFGYPKAVENDPARAVQAALTLQKKIKQFYPKPAFKKHLSLELRIGINTGRVIVGEVGGAARKDITVMGDAVNVAFRLQQHCPTGGVLVSENVYPHIKTLFSVKSMKPVVLKGKSDPVKVYEVQGELTSGATLGPDGILGLPVPFVGREKEIKMIRDFYRRCLSTQKPKIVFLSGEPGFGKTKLVEEFLKNATSQKYFLAGASAKKENPYYYVAQLIQQLRTEMDPMRNTALIELDSVAWEDMVNLFNIVLGAREKGLSALGEESEMWGGRLADYVVLLLKHKSQKSPQILILENLHAADESSLSLLSLIFQRMVSGRVFVLGTFSRAWHTRHAAFIGISQAVTLRLRPLNQKHVQELIHSLFPELSEASSRLSKVLAERSQGNAYYLMELIRHLRDIEVIEQHTNGSWILKESQTLKFDVPQTLELLLSSRLDSLEEKHRETLKKASVAGHVFWDDCVQYMSPDEKIPPDVFSFLTSKEFIYPRRPSFQGFKEYAFSHILMRDTLYSQIPRRTRESCHLLAAVWLARACKENPRGFAATIARHFESASDYEKALEWYVKAGKLSNESYAFVEGEKHLKQALRLARSLKKRNSGVEIMLRLGEAYEGRSQYTKAVQSYKKALSVAKSIEDQGAAGILLAMITEVFFRQDRFEKAKSWGENALCSPAIQRNRHAHALLLVSLARVYRQLGEYDQALNAFHNALGYKKLSIKEKTLALYNIGLIYGERGNQEIGEDYLEKALTLCQQTGHRYGEAWSYINLGWHCYHSGKYMKALQGFRDGLRIFHAIGDKRGETYALVDVAWVLKDMGAYHEAHEAVQRAVALAEDFGGMNILAESFFVLSQVKYCLEYYGEALYYCKKAVKLSNASNFAALWVQVKMFLLLISRSRVVNTQVKDILRKAKKVSVRWIEAHTTFFAVEVLTQRRLFPEARGYFEEGMKTAKTYGLLPNLLQGCFAGEKLYRLLQNSQELEIIRVLKEQTILALKAHCGPYADSFQKHVDLMEAKNKS